MTQEKIKSKTIFVKRRLRYTCQSIPIQFSMAAFSSQHG